MVREVARWEFPKIKTQVLTVIRIKDRETVFLSIQLTV